MKTGRKLFGKKDTCKNANRWTNATEAAQIQAETTVAQKGLLIQKRLSLRDRKEGRGIKKENSERRY